MISVGTCELQIKKYKKNLPPIITAARIAESFLRSTPFEDDLKKLSSGHPKLGGSEESFRLVSCYAESPRPQLLLR